MTYRAPLMKHLGGGLALRVFKRAVSRNLPAKLSETKKITCSKHEKASINNKATTYGVEERMGKVKKTFIQKAGRFLSIAPAPENISEIRV